VLPMAFIEMSCKCEASFQADVPDSDNLILLWAQSFVLAHQECGFMSRINTDLPEKTVRYDIMYKEQREKEL